MRRRLLPIPAIVSGLLAVGVVALWVRSYFATDQVAREGDPSILIYSGRGTLLVHVWYSEITYEPRWSSKSVDPRDLDFFGGGGVLGFNVYRSGFDPAADFIW